MVAWWAKSIWTRRWRSTPSFLPCYWHQHQLFCSRYLLQAQRGRRLRVGFLISPSVDGELGAMIVRRAGGFVIRGSSSHTGALALKGYFEALVREQVSPVINPDGPRGPRFKFKPGAILLAQMSGRAMLPIGLRRIARLAGALGPVRAADAVLPHRHCASDRRAQVPRVLDAAGMQACSWICSIAASGLRSAAWQPHGARQRPAELR